MTHPFAGNLNEEAFMKWFIEVLQQSIEKIDEGYPVKEVQFNFSVGLLGIEINAILKLDDSVVKACMN